MTPYTWADVRAGQSSMTPREKLFAAAAKRHLRRLERGPATEAATDPNSDPNGQRFADTDDNLAEKLGKGEP